MNIRLLISLMTIFLLTTPLYGFYPPRLESEAELHKTRIFSNIPPEEEEIKKSVAGFLRDNETLQPKDIQLKIFQKFEMDLIHQAEEENLITFSERQNLISFSEACKKIYEESDETYRAGICLLLERVQEKSLKDLARLRKLRKFKMQEFKEQKHLDQTERDEIFKKMFSEFF